MNKKLSSKAAILLSLTSLSLSALNCGGGGGGDNGSAGGPSSGFQEVEGAVDPFTQVTHFTLAENGAPAEELIAYGPQAIPVAFSENEYNKMILSPLLASPGDNWTFTPNTDNLPAYSIAIQHNISAAFKTIVHGDKNGDPFWLSQSEMVPGQFLTHCDFDGNDEYDQDEKCTFSKSIVTYLIFTDSINGVEFNAEKAVYARQENTKPQQCSAFLKKMGNMLPGEMAKCGPVGFILGKLKANQYIKPEQFEGISQISRTKVFNLVRKQ